MKHEERMSASRWLAVIAGSAVLAGGLLVPARADAQTVTTPRAEKRAEKRAEAASEEPDPKSKIVWLEAEGGVENVNLNTFTENFQAFSVGFLPRSGTGPAVGAAAGLRLVFVTLGVRGRAASFQDTDPSHNVHGWSMSSVDGELGFRIPLRRVEPYVTLAGGYTTLGGLNDAISGLSQGLDVNGFNGRLGFGVDYFLSKYISLGADFTGEVLVLTRPGIPVREMAAIPSTQGLDQAAVRFLEANGASYGSALALTGGLKAHF